MALAALADHVQLALKGVGDHHVGAAADEDLADHRLLGLDRGRHGHRRIGSARRASPGRPGLRHGRRARSLLRRRDGRRVPWAGRSCPRRNRRRAAASTPCLAISSRNRVSGIWIRMPAPSPCSGSAPTAPRWSRFFRIFKALAERSSWVLLPLICAMKPTPQASCSLAGSYRPCSWGRSISYFLDTTHTGTHIPVAPDLQTAGSRPAEPSKKPAHRSAGDFDPDEETVQTHWARLEDTAADAGFSRFFCSAATGEPLARRGLASGRSPAWRSVDLADREEAAMLAALRTCPSCRRCSRRWRGPCRRGPWRLVLGGSRRRSFMKAPKRSWMMRRALSVMRSTLEVVVELVAQEGLQHAQLGQQPGAGHQPRRSVHLVEAGHPTLGDVGAGLLDEVDRPSG